MKQSLVGSVKAQITPTTRLCFRIIDYLSMGTHGFMVD